MLINGFQYIIPCQCRFSRTPIDQIIAEQYQNVSTIIKDCLKDNRIPIADQRAKQAFSALESIFKELQSRRISTRTRIRAQREYKLVKNIQCLLRQRPDIVIRRTDKNKIFYIGKAIDFQRKSEEYMQKTEAYEKMTDNRCPLAEHLSAVQTLLNYLEKAQVITSELRKKISPKLNQLELGYYHGLPKLHKVN